MYLCFFSSMLILITLIISSLGATANQLLNTVLQPPSSIENYIYNVFLNESNFLSLFPYNVQFLEKGEMAWKSESVINEMELSEKGDEEMHQRKGKRCLRNVTKCWQEANDYQNTLKQLREQIHSINSPLDFSILPGVTKECKSQSYRYIKSLEQFKLWALKMYDANAKLPSGFLRGNINQYGDFDLCTSISSDDLNIKGQYCLASLQVKTPSSSYLSAIHNLMHSHYIFKSNIKDPGHRVPRFSSIHWGLCIPNSCNFQDVEIALKNTLNKIINGTKLSFDLEVDPTMCETKQSKQLPFSTILVSAFFILVISIAVCATVFDYFDLKINELLLAFSFIKAKDVLLSTRRSTNDIQAVHGIRCMNAIFLLGSHKSMAVFFIPFVNRTYLAEILGKEWSIFGRAASLYTDPFIMISGTLTTYALLNKLQQGKRINLLQEYFSRLLRIVPPLGAVMLFCTFVLPWIGSGPQWNLVVSHHAKNCKMYWWRNLLFIHNYFGFKDMCLTHTHHVGIDMQLFVWCTIIIPFVSKWPKRGLLALFLLAALSTAMRYYVTLTKNLSNFIHFGTSIQQLFSTADNMYSLPSHRATVYIMGIFLGHLLTHKKSYCLNSYQLFVGNVLAFTFFCTSFFGATFMGCTGYIYNPTHAAWYAAFAPIFWCASFAWIIFTTYTNQAGVIGRALSWKGFLIATRLSYAVYLTQFPVYFYNVGTTRSPEYFSFFTVINLIEYGVVILVSIILTVLFDLPFQQIKQAMNKKTKKQTRDAEQKLK